MKKITRRRFLGLAALALPAAVGVDARFIETTSLRVTNLKCRGVGNCRFIHFSDFHHKGDIGYATEVVRTINELAPDFVCFTGDLVEKAHYATEALGFIRQIRAPVYGSPGNHEFQSGVSFAEFEEAFASTGGAWLSDRVAHVPAHDLELLGLGLGKLNALPPLSANRQILLMHYPEMANGLGARRFDLILAGHSHGGQVRLPFLGALVVPRGVGPYDHGYYETPGGPLYVNAGIGTYRLPLRWNCRPEITVVTM